MEVAAEQTQAQAMAPPLEQRLLAQPYLDFLNPTMVGMHMVQDTLVGATATPPLIPTQQHRTLHLGLDTFQMRSDTLLVLP